MAAGLPGGRAAARRRRAAAHAVAQPRRPRALPLPGRRLPAGHQRNRQRQRDSRAHPVRRLGADAARTGPGGADARPARLRRIPVQPGNRRRVPAHGRRGPAGHDLGRQSRHAGRAVRLRAASLPDRRRRGAGRVGAGRCPPRSGCRWIGAGSLPGRSRTSRAPAAISGSHGRSAAHGWTTPSPAWCGRATAGRGRTCARADRGYRCGPARLPVASGVHQLTPLGGERHRKAIAIEPMTCPPNAFVSGDDLIVLCSRARRSPTPGVSRPAWGEGPAGEALWRRAAASCARPPTPTTAPPARPTAASLRHRPRPGTSSARPPGCCPRSPT